MPLPSFSLLRARTILDFCTNACIFSRVKSRYHRAWVKCKYEEKQCGRRGVPSEELCSKIRCPLSEKQEFRKRVRKYTHLASSLEGARGFEAREHLHAIYQAFARFLGDATDFYSSLLRRFEAMHHQYAKGGNSADGRSSGSLGGSGSEQRRSRLLRLMVLSINRCLIFLGDLARYRELQGENTVKDWSSAERYYHQVCSALVF